ncbi:hypothetical protein AB0G04_43625 [Actinoplanes sp. NPDC023801]|uniref:WXG100 family type VII secretion target n=1 Tax=Actinoplanes sp. NPDC023801 TaxID=3154595 RepID=UPI0033FB6333
MELLMVEPSTLVSFAAQIERASDDVKTVKDYIAKNSQNGIGGEFFSIAAEGHQHAMQQVQVTLSRVIHVLDQSAPELRSAATYYGTTTLEAARQIDSALPEGLKQCPTILEYEISNNPCKYLPFDDSRGPEQYLKPPDDAENPPNKAGIFEYISPSAWILKGLEIIVGRDPVTETQTKMFGDWEAIGRMISVMNNASLAMHDIAINVQSGATALPGLWQGNAGDTAYQYFTDLATAIDELRPAFAAIAEEYRIMTDAVWAAGDALGGVIKAMCDAALLASAAAVGGSATSWTGGGAAIGYGIAAIAATDVLLLWGQAMALFQNVNGVVLAFRSAMNRSVSDLAAVQLPAIGGGSGYDHPLAGQANHV